MLRGGVGIRNFFSLGIMMSLFSVLGSLFIGKFIPQEKIKSIIAILLMTLVVKNIFHIHIPFLKELQKNKWIFQSVWVCATMGIYIGAIGLRMAPLFLMIGKSVFGLKNSKASCFAKLMSLLVNIPSLLIFILVLKSDRL